MSSTSESSLAKWLNVCLRTKWLWVRIPLLLHSSWLFILFYKIFVNSIFFLFAVCLVPVKVRLRLTVVLAGGLFMLFLPIFFAPSMACLLLATFTSSPRLTSSNIWTPLSKATGIRPLFTTGANVLVNPIKALPIP